MTVVRNLNRTGLPTQRRRILVAAVRAFAADGYHGTQCAAIAVRAAVSLSSIDYHFHGKDALFSAALDTVLSRSAFVLNGALNRTTPQDRMKVFATTDVAWWTEHPSAALLLARHYQRSNWPRLWRRFAEWELERHLLAFGTARPGTALVCDARSREAAQRRSSEVLRMRLALDLVLTLLREGQAGRTAVPLHSVADLSTIYLDLICPDDAAAASAGVRCATGRQSGTR